MTLMRLGGALALLLAACGPEGPRTDSQTNWFRACERDADCAGLSCLCGVCTEPCDDSTCGGGAECFSGDGPQAVAACDGRVAPAPVCLQVCAGGCPGGQTCVAGVCIPEREAPASVIVDTQIRYQELVGLGASVAYGEPQLLLHPRSEELFSAMFSELGLDMLRLRNRYGYVGDDDLSTAGELLDAATTSLGHVPQVFLSSWSPPAALKANGDRWCAGNPGTCTLAPSVDGGFDYAAFANHWRASLEAYAAVGVVPDFIGLQNNPDFVPLAPSEACRFLPTEGSMLIDGQQVELPGFSEALTAVVDALDGLENVPQVVAPNTAGVSLVGAYLSGLDPALVQAIGHHYYDVSPGNLAGLSAMAELGKDLERPLFQTEMTANGLTTATLIHQAFVTEGVSVYLQGVLAAPTLGSGEDSGILIALAPEDFSLEPAYYALRHFAFYTEPGWVRAEAIASDPRLLASAWVSPEGEVVVVLVNPGPVAIDVALDLDPTDSLHVVRTVFPGVERFADLGELSADGRLRVPAESVVTVAP